MRCHVKHEWAAKLNDLDGQVDARNVTSMVANDHLINKTKTHSIYEPCIRCDFSVFTMQNNKK